MSPWDAIGVQGAHRTARLQSGEGSGSQVLRGLGAPLPPSGSCYRDPHYSILSKVSAVPPAQDSAT